MSKVIVRTIGGLGFDQTWAIRMDLAGMSGVFAPDPPIATNVHKLDFAAATLITAAPFIAVVGHSLGADAAIALCIRLAGLGYPAHYLCIIEKVWTDCELPPLAAAPDGAGPDFRAWDVFQCDAAIDFPRGEILGALAETIRDTDHNTICHASEVIGRIHSRVQCLANLRRAA